MRLHEAEQELHRKAAGTGEATLYEDDVTWMLRYNNTIYGYAVRGNGECLITYEEGRMYLRATTNDERTWLNHALPESVQVKSVKRDRWVVTGLDNVRQVPFHNSISLGNLEHSVTDPRPGWVVTNSLLYPNKQHIPKAIQKMVKKWAANYRPGSNIGACGLCIAHNEHLMSMDTAEVNHLLEHVLTRTLPYVMMDSILRDIGSASVRRGDVLPFRQACYQMAVTYAYRTLRSTYA